MKFLRKSLKKFLFFLLSPISFGIIITLSISFGTLKYYDQKENINNLQNSFFQILTWIEQKTNDFRFLDRGIKPISDNIAILAIDDYSIEQIGRWPWPRNKIAQIIEELIKYKADVIAFDMIFSEADESSIKILKKIKKNPHFSLPKSKKILNKMINDFNTDQTLVNKVKKHSSNVIMGTYFDPLNIHLYPYQNYCINLAYQKTRFWENWDKEIPLIVFDEFEFELPEAINLILNEIFNKIKNDNIKDFMSTGKISNIDDLPFNQKQILETSIYEKQKNYCSKWLDKNDPYLEVFQKNWAIIKADEEEITNLDFTRGINLLKNKYLINPIIPVGRWWMSYPSLADVTENTGFFLADLDSDGVIRKSPLIAVSGNQYAPSLALKAFLLKNKYQAQIFIKRNLKNPIEKSISDFIIADNEGNKIFSIPVNKSGKININYYGPNNIFPYVSAYDLLKNSSTLTIKQLIYNSKSKKYQENTKKEKKEEFIKNKIFFVGATAPGIFDMRVTPFSKNFPGVETHANVLENLITQNFLMRHPAEEILILISMLSLGIILTLILNKLGAISGIILTLLVLIVIYFIDKFYFFKSGTIVNTFLPTILVIVIYIFLTVYKYFTEERKKKELKGTFAKYVSPAIVEEILSDPNKVELGGRKAHLTVLFSDIRGFTTISERLNAKSLAIFLNNYLTPMTKIVFDHKGTLDKYMGDAVMAFFGAPIYYEDHPTYACNCALDMLKKLKELRIQYEKENLPYIDIGIGINTGHMSVGNMGSNIIRDYTVMGDAVNLGSRLEGVNKEYGTNIMISEFTYNLIKNKFIIREIDLVKVKGKEKPVKIFELISNEELNKEAMEALNYFSKAYNLYHQKNFSQAIIFFNKTLNINPLDTCSKLYTKRCQNYINNPPSKDWDGIFTMKNK